MLQWYALNTKPHKERQVQKFLSSQDIEIFFPTVVAPRVRRPARARAFFPCYLFAHTDIGRVGLWNLQYTPGMRRVVMCGEAAIPVPEQVILDLRDRLDRVHAASGDHTLAVDSAGDVLERGDRVRITAGPLADVDAFFDERLSSEGRVRVLIQSLDRWSKVDVAAASITKVLPPRPALFAS